MGKSQRDKGHGFERRVAKDLREFWPEAKRGFQTRGGTSEAPDVDGTPFFVECKAHKRVDRDKAMTQAYIGMSAHRGAHNYTLGPIAICKDDRQEPVVRMWSTTLYRLLTHALSYHVPVPVEIEYSRFLDLCARWVRLDVEPQEAEDRQLSLAFDEAT